jgi:hypothetical protein
MLLENGMYRAVVKDVSVYLRGENERLTAAFRVECEGKELVHREWLELNDGTISDKTTKRLRACFPKWDGTIEALEQGFCVQDVDVEVTVENEQDKQEPEKWWTRTKFMDPPGGSSGGAAMPERANRASLVSKYGARFRALAGGTPARAVGSAQSAVGSGAGSVGSGQSAVSRPERGARAPLPPAPPVKPTAKPAEAPATPSTLEECWEALCKKHPDELREQVSDRWFKLLGDVVPDKDQADLAPADWGRVLAVITSPF